MAINYTKIGWDTSKYVNPTNMNQMDDGIKAACDAIDSEVLKLTNDALQTIANTATGANAAVSLKSNNVRSVADYRDQNGTALGMMGFDSNKKPTIYDVPSNTWKEIALADNVIAKNSDPAQVITNTRTGQYVTLFLKSSHANGMSLVGFQDVNNTNLGYLGVNASKRPVFYDNTDHEIALVENVVSKKGMTVPATVTTVNDLISAVATQALSDGFGAHVYTGIWTGNNFFEAVVYAIESNHATGEIIYGGYTYAPYIYTFSYYNGTTYTRTI